MFYQLLLDLHVDCSGKCHIESFNFMLGDGLKLAVADLDPVEFLVPETNDRISLWITDASVSKPSVAAGSVGATNSQVLLHLSLYVSTMLTFFVGRCIQLRLDREVALTKDGLR